MWWLHATTPGRMPSVTQAVRVRRAKPDDRYGDIHVDTDEAHAQYHAWLEKTRPAAEVSPDATSFASRRGSGTSLSKPG